MPGFSTAGATFADVELMKKYIGKDVKVKAAGGILSFDDAEKAFLSLKLRRNRVAHDYINGMTDTFVDIQNFYDIAVIYVVSLEAAIEELTNT